MASIQQLTYVAPSQLEWQEVARPTLQTGRDAIVQPLAVARCDLDLYIARGLFRAPGPFALGHEIAGVIVDVADGVKGFRPGDRVIVPFQISCGECTNCRRGWTNACSAVPPCAAYGLGSNPDGDFGGGLSDLLRVPFADAMLQLVPAALTLEQACGLSDNVADGYRTVAPYLQQYPGERVLVAGGLAQSVGLYAVQAALALGASEVCYVDYDAKRLEIAKGLGAVTQRVNYEEQGEASEDYLITVDAACTASGTAFALRSTAPCGFCTSVSGGLSPTTELPLNSVYLKGINYNISRVHGRAILPQVLHKVCCGSMDPLSFVSRQVSFAEAAESMTDTGPKIIFTRSD